MKLSLKEKIPVEVLNIIGVLTANGYEAYLVGGCVRDLLLQRKPRDFDITTNASPEVVQQFFPESFYENKFGTVAVKTGSEDERLKVVEVTTYRIEQVYSDLRHPEAVVFADKLEDDLKRRDFTINALALDQAGKVVDFIGGLSDLKSRLIRTVGSPIERFKEDALRLIRAVRLAVELDFQIEPATLDAIKNYAYLIQFIARERLRDELTKIIMSDQAVYGIELLRQTNLLIELIPELLQGRGVLQNKHHKYDIYEHLLYSLDYAVKQKYPLELRLSALLHDIGKPLTKQGEYPNATFYQHEIVGAKIAKQILHRLRFSKTITNYVFHLVRHHMFYLEIDKVTMSAVRRFVRRVGEECLEDLFRLREADRIGSGVPKAVPYRLRYLKFLIKKAKLQPITPTMLKINGYDVMELLQIPSGPKVGWVLKILLEEVLDKPELNNPDYLKKRAKELGNLTDEELKKLALMAEEKKKSIEAEVDKKIKKEYQV